MNGILFSHIDHLVVNTSDLSKNLAFYTCFPGTEIARENQRGIVKIGRQKLNIHIFPSSLFPLAEKPVCGRQIFQLTAKGEPDSLLKIFSLRLKKNSLSCQKVAIANNQRVKILSIYDDEQNLIQIFFDAPKSDPFLTGLYGITIQSKDPIQLYNFYANLLIPAELSNSSIPAKQPRVTFIKKNKNSGSSDFCLITERSVSEIFKTISSPPLLTNPGLVERSGALGALKSFYMRDPEGNLIEISNYQTPLHLSSPY